MKKIFQLLMIVNSIFIFSQPIDNLTKSELNEIIKKSDSLIDVDPSAENFYYRGFYRNANKDYFNASIDYNNAIAINNNNFDYRFSRAKNALDLFKYKLAIEDLTICLKINPNSVKCLDNRAFAYTMNTQQKEAIEDYTKCLNLEPENRKAMLNRGILRRDLNQCVLALQDFVSY